MKRKWRNPSHCPKCIEAQKRAAKECINKNENGRINKWSSTSFDVNVCPTWKKEWEKTDRDRLVHFVFWCFCTCCKRQKCMRTSLTHAAAAHTHMQSQCTGIFVLACHICALHTKVWKFCPVWRWEMSVTTAKKWIGSKWIAKNTQSVGDTNQFLFPRFFSFRIAFSIRNAWKKTASTPWIRLHSPLKLVNPHLFVNCYLPFTCSWCSNRAKCQKYLNFIDLILFLSFSFFRSSSFFVS